MTTPTAVQDSWKAAQIVGGRHFVPVAFTYLAFDDTVDVVLGEETVTHPTARNQQDTTACRPSQRAPSGDLEPPDSTLPQGVALTDAVPLSFMATVIVKHDPIRVPICIL